MYMMKKFIYVLILICLATISLSGCGNDKNNIKLEKGLSEVRYLENQNITMFNKFLTNEYSIDTGEIDWEAVTEDFNIFRNSVDVILIDFASIQIPSKSIVDLENCFRNMENFLTNKDLYGFIGSLCDCYNLASYSILDNMPESEEIKLEKKAKTDLLYVGYYIMSENRVEGLNNLNMFETNYSNLSSNKKYLENNSYKVNKIFMNIQNLRGQIEDQNFDMAKETLIKIFEFF